MNKRALRRHHIVRLKKRRLRDNYWYKDLTPGNLGICVNTPCVCSCWMCGNPRKHYNELTRQEIRSIDSYYNQLNCNMVSVKQGKLFL